MKVLDISILRTAAGNEDPIPLVAASELSSFGYFQRQVRNKQLPLTSSFLFLFQVIFKTVF
jgi:hypothetical protein